ncbi:hypothetical protein B0H17DRAFT_357310 [Mycena rosella]|uniref:Uncharacterized protein n=1 Tax=Mycena rosella TaxID=1033263 RepID=A0AAD7CPR8_MYCRO|nr:hypothetical protein B0H17DRAFT_357310 [Mycena rosella]
MPILRRTPHWQHARPVRATCAPAAPARSRRTALERPRTRVRTILHARTQGIRRHPPRPRRAALERSRAAGPPPKPADAEDQIHPPPERNARSLRIACNEGSAASSVRPVFCSRSRPAPGAHGLSPASPQRGGSRTGDVRSPILHPAPASLPHFGGPAPSAAVNALCHRLAFLPRRIQHLRLSRPIAGLSKHSSRSLDGGRDAARIWFIFALRTRSALVLPVPAPDAPACVEAWRARMEGGDATRLRSSRDVPLRMRLLVPLPDVVAPIPCSHRSFARPFPWVHCAHLRPLRVLQLRRTCPLLPAFPAAVRAYDRRACCVLRERGAQAPTTMYPLLRRPAVRCGHREKR